MLNVLCEFKVYTRRRVIGFLIALFCAHSPVSARAAWEGPAQMCAQSALTASKDSGVPYDVLMAIAKTETGRSVKGRFQPWPWTINTRGMGKWYDSRSALLQHAQENLARGETSFDVGCFQINYRWHGQHFASLSDMIDPVVNARYAARFLTQLYHEFGNWTDAAGAYHSRTEVHAARYRKLFTKHRSASKDAPVPAAPERRVSAPRQNTFPLLQASHAASHLGSLVPAQLGAAQNAQVDPEMASHLGGLVK